MAEKSILEQALLQIENLEEAVKQNSKGILSSVMKKEFNDLLKESSDEDNKMMKEKKVSKSDMKEEDDISDDDDDDTNVPSDNASDDDDEDTSSPDDEDMPSPDDDMSSSEDDDMSSEDDDMSSEDDDMPEPSSMSGPDDSVMDMTKASDEEVLRVYRAMKPDDGIVVKKEGNVLDIDINGDEYIIKLDELENEMTEGDMSDEDMSEEDMSDESAQMDEEETEETVYEIELDASDEDDDTTKEETKESKVVAPYKSSKGVKKVEATEAARTKWNVHGNKGEAKRAGLPSKKMFKAGSVNEEVAKLRKQNDEYKKALVLFKEKLNEVAVFNASLAYSTKIMTEHSTTKQEKLNILKRFDSVSSINECKKLYSTIKTELSNKKPISESVAEKITSMPKTSTSKEVLAESKAYENPQFKRMKELMAKIK